MELGARGIESRGRARRFHEFAARRIASIGSSFEPISPRMI